MLASIRLLAVLPIVFLLVSCEDNHLEVYEEPITTLFYVLTPDSGQTVVLNHIDNDGVGGKPPLVNKGTLRPHTTYRGTLMIGNRNPLTSPRLSHIIDSTSVGAQPELHQVFFEPEKGLQLHTSYTDRDKNGYPVGMETVLQTGPVSEGALVISIIHAPNKSAANVMLGDRTRAGGTIDAQATFEMVITSN